MSPVRPCSGAEDWVSRRGALTLHALRTEIGEESLFGILRSWVTANRGGSVTTESFVTHCSRELGRDLPARFTPWLDETSLPPLPGKR